MMLNRTAQRNAVLGEMRLPEIFWMIGRTGLR